MIAALMPWHDWQFYLVTALALAGLWLALRPLLGPKKSKGCASCSFAQKNPTLPAEERLVVLGRAKPHLQATDRRS